MTLTSRKVQYDQFGHNTRSQDPPRTRSYTSSILYSIQRPLPLHFQSLIVFEKEAESRHNSRPTHPISPPILQYGRDKAEEKVHPDARAHEIRNKTDTAHASSRGKLTPGTPPNSKAITLDPHTHPLSPLFRKRNPSPRRYSPSWPAGPHPWPLRSQKLSNFSIWRTTRQLWSPVSKTSLTKRPFPFFVVLTVNPFPKTRSPTPLSRGHQRSSVSAFPCPTHDQGV